MAAKKQPEQRLRPRLRTKSDTFGTGPPSDGRERREVRRGHSGQLLEIESTADDRKAWKAQ